MVPLAVSYISPTALFSGLGWFWKMKSEIQFSTPEHPRQAVYGLGLEIWLVNPSSEYPHSPEIHRPDELYLDLDAAYQDIIRTPHTLHRAFAKHREGCSPIQHDTYPDYQT